MVPEQISEEETVTERVRWLALVSLAASQEAAVVEHVFAGRVQRPVVSLPGVAGLTGDFHETVVERKVVPYRILPHGILVPVEGEPVPNELADS